MRSDADTPTDFTPAASIGRFGMSVAEFCEKNAGWLLGALLVWAAVLRLEDWGVYWVNADEGLYFDGATTELARSAGTIRTNAHPPLFWFVLRAIHMLGGGIEAMRAMSVAAGVALPAVGFLVARRWGGAAAGLFAALLLVNSPGAVVLSTIMRPYALQFLSLALATLFLFRYFDRGAMRDLAGLGVASAVAMLLHYATFQVVAGMIAYTGWLVVSRQLDRRRTVGLGCVFAGLVALAVALYVGHILPNLEGRPIQATATGGWLRELFADGPKHLVRLYFNLAVYLFGRPACYVVPWLVPAAALLAPAGERGRPALFALAIIAVAGALSYLGKYPFGPGRHSTYLAVFMAPAAGAALAGMLRSPRAPLVAAGGLSVALVLIGAVYQPVTTEELELRHDDAVAVSEHLQETTKPGDLVLMDYQSFLVFRPLFDVSILPERFKGSPSRINGFESKGRTYAFVQQWAFNLEDTRDDLADMIAELMTTRSGSAFDPDPAVRGVWIFEAGWGERLGARLPRELPGGRVVSSEHFVRPGVMFSRIDAPAYLGFARAGGAAR